jgi:hypothetical protein
MFDYDVALIFDATMMLIVTRAMKWFKTTYQAQAQSREGFQ